MCQRRQKSRRGDRLVGRVEVERQAQAEHQRHADRHVGIAGEVEVELEGEGQAADPGLGGGQRGAAPPAEKAGSARWASVSAMHDLLGQADDEQHQAAAQILPSVRAARVALELRDDLVVAHQRPGDQLREEGDEHPEVEEAVDVPVAAAQVHQVADLLEHEEADPERQDQAARAARSRRRCRTRCRG